MTPDLLLVFPNNRRRAYGGLAGEVAAVTPPLQLALTAAYCRREGISVSVLDADAEDLGPAEAAARVADLRPRLALLSTDSLNSGDVTKMAAASETLKAIRAAAPDLPVVLEGVVPSAFPERMLREEGADYVCRGEAFQPVADLARALRSGEARPKDRIRGVWWLEGDGLVDGDRGPLPERPDELPLAAWDLLPMDRYRAHHWHCFGHLDRRSPYASIYTNLGCPYACTFCNVNVVAGKPNFRPRSPENVVEEVDLLVKRYGVRNIRIVDNVFTIRPDLVEKLCDLLIARGHDLNFWAYARVETIRSPELLAKMKKAGVNWLAYGIEAADPKVRKAVEKPSPETTIERAIEMTRSAGIHMVGNFIFGLPEDDHATMRRTFQMAKDHLFEYANFYAAMAYPGTELHEQARREGQTLPDTWTGYGQYSFDALPLATRHLRSAEVLKFRDEAFVEYHTYPPYRERLRSLFGREAVDYVDRILGIKLRRRLLEKATG